MVGYCFKTEPIRISQNKGFAGITRYWKQGSKLSQNSQIRQINQKCVTVEPHSNATNGIPPITDAIYSPFQFFS